MAGRPSMFGTLLRSDQGSDSDISTTSQQRRTWTLTVACACVSMVVSSMIALNTALGDIAVSTSATQTQLMWVVDSYTLALACLLLPAGAIGDRYGRRKALLAGLAIFSVASVAPIWLDSPIQIIVARAVAGVGAAFVMPSTLSLLTAVYPKDQRVKAVGIWAGVTGCGAVLGMLVSGLLLRFWSWQSIFISFTAAGILLFVLTLTVTESRDGDAPPVDWPGAALIGSAVAVFVLGVVEAPTHGWGHPLVYGSMAGGLALATAFGIVELRQRRPLLDIRLFAIPEFATGAASVTILFFANFGVFYLVMQYTQEVMGYSALGTALAFAPLFVPVLILSSLSFWYLPKLGLRLVVFGGLTLMAAGIFCMRILDSTSSYFDFAWPVTVFALGIGLCTASTTSAIMNTAPDEKQGVASAVNDTTREMGAALGIAVAGSILAAHYGHVLRPRLDTFPEPLRGPASNSLAEALEVSKHIGPQGNQLAQVATASFVDAMHSSLLTLSIIIAVAAVAIALWSPGRDGAQLRITRRLRRSSAGDDEVRGPVREHHDTGVRTAAGDRG